MSHRVVTGLVARAVEYKEADLILTVLTAEEGKLTITARGARRNNAPYAAASQILCCSRMIVSEYRERLTLKEAEILESFPALREDLQSLSLACYIADLAQTLAPEGDIFRLLVTALLSLAGKKRPPELVKAAFELRALCEAGFEPSLGGCGRCGGLSEIMYLQAFGGMLLCSSCGREAREDILLPADTDTLAAVRYVSSAPPEKVFSFALGERPLNMLAALCERYTVTQIDRVLPSLEYYNGIK